MCSILRNKQPKLKFYLHGLSSINIPATQVASPRINTAVTPYFSPRKPDRTTKKNRA